MLQPELSPPRYGFDLMSLPLADWTDPETLPSIRRLADSLLKLDPRAELFLVAPKFMERGLKPYFSGGSASSQFIPLLSLLPPRIYFQQVALPVLFRLKGVNRIVSFGHGVPAIYPAPKLLSLLPGQARDWWRLVPSLMTADVVVTDTQTQKLAIESRLTRLRSRIEVVAPAVSEEFHPYPKDAGRELFERHGVKGRFVLFLGTTGLNSSSLMVALEAFSKIAHRPRMKSIHFIAITPNRLTLIPLRKRVEELGLAHRVCFVDEIPLAELPLWLSGAQFAMCPEQGDVAANLLLRALASGCPVIVPSQKLCDSLMRHAVLQCHDSDPKSLAEAMTRVLAEPELRDGLVKEGLELSKLRTWTARGESFLRIFSSLLHSRDQIETTDEVLSPEFVKPELTPPHF